MANLVKIFSTFPECFPGTLGVSKPGRALKNGAWNLSVVNIRDFADDKHQTCDDTVYGGGAGMLLKVDVLSRAIECEAKKDNLRLNRNFVFCGAESCDAESFGAGSCGADPSEVGSSGVESCGVDSSEVGSSGVESCGVDSSKVGSSGAESCGVGSSEIKSFKVSSFKVGSSGAESCGVESSEIKSSKVGSSKAEFSGVESCGVDSSEAGSSGAEFSGVESCGFGSSEIKSFKVSSFKVGSSGAESCGVESFGSESCGVDSPEVGSSGVGSSEAESCGVESSEIKSSKVGSSKAEFSGVESCGVDSSEVGSSGAEFSGAESCSFDFSEVGSFKVDPSSTGSSGVESCGVDSCGFDSSKVGSSGVESFGAGSCGAEFLKVGDDVENGEGLSDDRVSPIILVMSARGYAFEQKSAEFLADSLSDRPIYIICARFEGIDERFIEAYNAIEVNLGRFVLFGGEVSALCIVESIIRLLPEVIEKTEALSEESYCDSLGGLMEYSQYTKPREWNSCIVPKVLLNGNEQKIKDWRFLQAKQITYKYQKNTLLDVLKGRF